MPRTSVAFIAVGANIEPERNIRAALTLLRKELRIVGSSTFYRTEPVGRPGQPKFINGVWRVDATLHPRHIRNEILRPAENQLGRRRTVDRYAPRTIDLDLVLYDDWIMNDAGFTLPHPDLCRPFVYVPVTELLAELASESPGDMPDRIRSLLPRPTVAESPGEELTGFTDQLRTLLRR
jgi:2-amino-4-hydroxy-6-hydroxymethyldihydropteridine diphosphokinase